MLVTAKQLKCQGKARKRCWAGDEIWLAPMKFAQSILNQLWNC
jgi:hypothetical protein